MKRDNYATTSMQLQQIPDEITDRISQNGNVLHVLET